MALATMLLVSATLLLQAFVRLQQAPLGFDPDGVITARIALPRPAYAEAARAGQFYERVLTTLRESGQVQAVAIGASAPFAPGVRVGFQTTDRRGATPDVVRDHGAAQHTVSGDYFRALGIPLLAGRSFTDRDDVGSPAVAVVTERLARLLWHGANPLGQILERDGRSYQIVGIVGDIRGADTAGARGGGPDRDPRAAVYLAARQSPQRTMTLLVRSNADTAAVAAVIRNAVRQADPTLAVQQIRPLREWLGESLAPTRFTTTLSTLFAATALLLASVGIYGVLAYIVGSRTREIGVRLAIGATRGRVLGLVFGQGMKWAAGGIVLGLIGAFAAARLISTLLFDVPAHDPATFATVGGAMALVSLIACSIPAARAVRIDPTTAMRTE
jgi:putative ABC transport system permease protein